MEDFNFIGVCSRNAITQRHKRDDIIKNFTILKSSLTLYKNDASHYLQ